MIEPEESEVPEGAAVFPTIPPDLNVHPLLLAVIHAIVFLGGSEDAVVNPEAGGETVDLMAGYLQRLRGKELATVRASMATLVTYARAEQWPLEKVEFLQTFLNDCGISEGGNR